MVVGKKQQQGLSKGHRSQLLLRELPVVKVGIFKEKARKGGREEGREEGRNREGEGGKEGDRQRKKV